GRPWVALRSVGTQVRSWVVRRNLVPTLEQDLGRHQAARELRRRLDEGVLEHLDDLELVDREHVRNVQIAVQDELAHAVEHRDRTGRERPGLRPHHDGEALAVGDLAGDRYTEQLRAFHVDVESGGG